MQRTVHDCALAAAAICYDVAYAVQCINVRPGVVPPPRFAPRPIYYHNFDYLARRISDAVAKVPTLFLEPKRTPQRQQNAERGCTILRKVIRFFGSAPLKA